MADSRRRSLRHCHQEPKPTSSTPTPPSPTNVRASGAGARKTPCGTPVLRRTGSTSIPLSQDAPQTPSRPSRSSRRMKVATARAPPRAPSSKGVVEASCAAGICNFSTPPSPHTASRLPMREMERTLTASGARCIIGIDEAGRGPLAGPVVAAACHIPLELDTCPEATPWLERIADSKKLTEANREAIFEWLTHTPSVRYAVQRVDAARIDEINILQATMQAMHECVCELRCEPDHVLVDGNRLPWGHVEGIRQDGSIRPADPTPPGTFKAEAVVKGDAKVLAIAAASVIAKVTRDRVMRDLDQLYPNYGLADHKGYPTAAHVGAIRRRGATAIHRMTFAPLKHMSSKAQRGPVPPRKKRPTSPTQQQSTHAMKHVTARDKRARRRLDL